MNLEASLAKPRKDEQASCRPGCASVVHAILPQDLPGVVDELVRRWPAGRQISERLVSHAYGDLASFFGTLSGAGVLLGGSLARYPDGCVAGWAFAVRHHERPGYGSTARLIFDLAEAGSGALEAMHRQCEEALRVARQRMMIGFSDDRSPVLSAGFRRLGFRSAGALSLGARASGRLEVYVKELVA
jgi:hypothetical protein